MPEDNTLLSSCLHSIARVYIHTIICYVVDKISCIVYTATSYNVK